MSAQWKLVPVEPTPEMFAADAPPIELPGDFATMKYRRGIYRAMLNAAPAAAQEPTVTLRERIDELIAQHGTLRAAARSLETDASYLSRLRYGEKDEPGESLLTRMGLRRTDRYERLAAMSGKEQGK